ncbi:hypothetical protein LMG28614_05938 [Paraburkholderia ultramafica]|uniref:Uncharacterized protein n=1 Tax=Paraburkholderia ultramafica TaxID=1544867 RepID=A0A6S7BLG8_9BURK|nr:hypothetical protein [Paraburkholderia ultramafica]CAB3804028.1 hypothetical protein LMG28614_05938 [Paraburkholderia ultramafica]
MTNLSATFSIEQLESQEDTLVFPSFKEDTALELGDALVAAARSRSAPVVIDIRTAEFNEAGSCCAEPQDSLRSTTTATSGAVS